MLRKNYTNAFLLLCCSILLINCSSSTEEVFTPSKDVYPEWEATSHGSQAKADYNLVLPKDQLNTIDLVISKADWDSLNLRQKDAYYGVDFGVAFNRITTKQNQQLNNSFSGAYIGKSAPAYVEAQLKFNGKTWKRVGLKYDGVLSLISNWTSGVRKLPFAVGMSAFASKYPETKGQKFYGFSGLTFDPGFNDTAMIANKTSADVFADNKVPTLQKAFYKVYIDNGDGRRYFGVYVASEWAEDQFPSKAYDNAGGNVYLPFSSLKTFVKGFMVKKNNLAEGNYADVETLISVLNSPLRTTNKILWLDRLNKHFDTDQYLKWLAINTAIRGDENHDEGYGLYTKANGRISIFNFQTTYCFRFPRPSTAQIADTEITVDLGYTKASDQYPLIKYLLAEPAYFAKYKAYVKEFNSSYFIPDKMNQLLDRNHNLIASAVAEESVPYSQLKNNGQFKNGLLDMKKFVTQQKVLLDEFVK